MGKIISKCVFCGGKKFSRSTREQIRQFNDTTFKVKVPCERCTSCGEGYTHASAIQNGDREIAIDLVKNGGPAVGRSLKHLRNAASLKAEELAELLGVSVTTLSRWENDRQPIDRATWLAVGDLVLEPVETRRRLEALSSSRAGKTVRISIEASPRG